MLIGRLVGHNKQGFSGFRRRDVILRMDGVHAFLCRSKMDQMGHLSSVVIGTVPYSVVCPVYVVDVFL